MCFFFFVFLSTFSTIYGFMHSILTILSRLKMDTVYSIVWLSIWIWGCESLKNLSENSLAHKSMRKAYKMQLASTHPTHYIIVCFDLWFCLWIYIIHGNNFIMQTHVESMPPSTIQKYEPNRNVHKSIHIIGSLAKLVSHMWDEEKPRLNGKKKRKKYYFNLTIPSDGTGETCMGAKSKILLFY